MFKYLNTPSKGSRHTDYTFVTDTQISHLLPNRGTKAHSLLYSVFFFRRLQKQVCCELVFRLMGNPKAVLGPQDWEQMTIRPEILLNKIKNEFERW